MKNFRLYLVTILTVLMVAPLSVSQAQTPAATAVQGVGFSFSSISAGGSTGYVPMLIKYIGSNPAGGTVTVAAGDGDITLKTGAVGSSSADTTTECPVSGALGGVIDMQDASCNTFGKVVDAINASPNWRAVLVDALRSDSSDNTTGGLFTLAETSASTAKGLALAGETASTFISGGYVGNLPRDDIRPYLNPGDNSLNLNPFNDSQTSLLFFTETTTYGSGTSTMMVYSVLPQNRTCTVLTSSIACTASENVTTLTSLGGSATATAPTALLGQMDFTKFPLPGRRGEKLIARVENSAAMSAITRITATGVSYKFIKNQ